MLDLEFRDAAITMKCDYILGEYTNLMDAWKVYQGVALYRLTFETFEAKMKQCLNTGGEWG